MLALILLTWAPVSTAQSATQFEAEVQNFALSIGRHDLYAAIQSENHHFVLDWVPEGMMGYTIGSISFIHHNMDCQTQILTAIHEWEHVLRQHTPINPRVADDNTLQAYACDEAEAICAELEAMSDSLSENSVPFSCVSRNQALFSLEVMLHDCLNGWGSHSPTGPYPAGSCNGFDPYSVGCE